jgi:ribosomal protein S18 acetylase RimI-like enzyme
MPFRLRPAEKSDAGYILMLEEACMRAYAVALWGNWRPSATPETLDITDHEIIEDEAKAVGCIAVTWYPEHLFIEKLYIDPAFQNRGLGALALRAKVAEAAARGLPTRLSVLTTNPANRFYEREGFTVETETPERRRMVRFNHAP